MNARIYSPKGANRLIDNAISQAYERRERSVDFLLLFSVKETEKEKLLTMVKENPLVLSAQWKFGTVLFTAYVKT
ncbi:hypothetical protein [Streptococcus gordonii]|jgi:hypothetical protein|uniref:hypothetical protein n=1 Tax=Streptococcus gordonii TaxID=1302 RepID=UPI0018AA9BA1|nr:hypothetical protein [Streptococcus gordonii]